MLRASRSVLALSAVLVITTLVASGAVVATDGAATGAAGETGESFVVNLESDGNATVTLTLTYDLADSSDGAAFETLRNDSATVTARFDERLSRIAERTAAETGREMTVSGVRVSVESTDGTGIVQLSARWHGLAAADDGTLTMTEPFASGFSTDRPLRISAPDGYEITATTPSATEANVTAATWDAGTDLDGFEVTAERTDSEPGAGGTTGSVPGFGIVTAVLVLLAAATVATLR